MIRRLLLSLGTGVGVAILCLPAAAQAPGDAKGSAPAVAAVPGATAPAQASPATVAIPATPAAPAAAAASPTTAAPVATVDAAFAAALRQDLAALPEGASDEERNETAALKAFYDARGFAGLWIGKDGVTPAAVALVAEIGRADTWGLDARDFPLPPAAATADAGPRTGAALPAETAAATELGLSVTALKYARYARGGRIINPSEQLTTYLDRRPQLLKPAAVLEGLATAPEADAYLRGLHPQHPQFQRLREKYAALLEQGDHRSRHRGRRDDAPARRLLANMEQWRWMPADLGTLYVWNNIPEYMQRVVKNGEVIRTERIVAGEVGKQTAIFSRPMRRITFKPTWKVPDSIKVRELWPSLLRGGGLMREWALEVQTKDGQRLDWRRIDWTRTDIREYDVIQENGPKSVMGKVKFTFPNPHTIFMHDTLERDKYMFNASRRTFSHGCMRVRDPLGLAQILLREQNGMEAGQVAEMFHRGPSNNEIPLTQWVPVHVTYFTAMVDEDGKLRTYPDVYGHEKRIAMALEGKWDRIVKGRDHLAPVELDLASAGSRRRTADAGESWGATDDLPTKPRRGRKGTASQSSFGTLFGGF